MASLSELQLDLTLNKEMLDLLNPDFQYTNIRNFPVTPPINTSALKLKDLSGTQAEESRVYFQTEVKRIQAEIYLLIQAPVLTYNYQSIYGTFTTQAPTESQAYQMFQEWLKQKESEVIPEPEPPEPEPPALLSASVKISFTNLNIGGFSSSIPIDDIGELQALSDSSPDWKYNLIRAGINQPIASLNELINNINNLLANVEPTPEPTPEIDISITDNMIIQRLDSFSIVNGRAIGQITFTATDSFNPNYYAKNITNVIQFKDPNGANILQVVKQNPLRFTATERTETITYDEHMKDNTRANVESFVLLSTTQPIFFSKKLKFEIVTTQEGQPAPVPKVQTTGFMAQGVAGAIAGLVLLGFIVDSKRGK